MTVKLYENETVLKAANTSYCENSAQVDGKLILTNQRIYFKTTVEEKRHIDFEILPNQIKEVLFLTLGRCFVSTNLFGIFINISFPYNQRNTLLVLSFQNAR